MQVVSDAQRAKFEAAIAAVKIRGARPRKEDRRTIEAIICRARQLRQMKVDRAEPSN